MCERLEKGMERKVRNVREGREIKGEEGSYGNGGGRNLH